MTLVPGKLTAVDTEGSSDRPASAKQAPVGTVWGGVPLRISEPGEASRAVPLGQLWAVCAPPPASHEGRWSSCPVRLRWCSAEWRPFALLFCLLFVSNSVHDANSSFSSAYFLFVSSLIHLR